jgi:hypothetical protein
MGLLSVSSFCLANAAWAFVPRSANHDPARAKLDTETERSSETAVKYPPGQLWDQDVLKVLWVLGLTFASDKAAWRHRTLNRIAMEKHRGDPLGPTVGTVTSGRPAHCQADLTAFAQVRRCPREPGDQRVNRFCGRRRTSANPDRSESTATKTATTGAGRQRTSLAEVTGSGSSLDSPERGLEVRRPS